MMLHEQVPVSAIQYPISYGLPDSNKSLPERTGVDRKLSEVNYHRFMSPQRQGNENFPEGSVHPPAGQHVGLGYNPWQGSDDDDLEYPTLNVQYEFEPKDWVKEASDRNEDRILRREGSKMAVNMMNSEMKLLKTLSGQFSDIQDMRDLLVSKQFSMNPGASGVIQRLPEGLKTGSGLDTPKEKRIETQLENLAPQVVEEANEYQGALLPVLFPGRDIYRHMADEYVSYPSSVVNHSQATQNTGLSPVITESFNRHIRSALLEYRYSYSS